MFQSFYLGGFECSDHRLQDGRRLDLLASTRHDELAGADYARLASLGITVCRDGISWARSEPAPGVFDFSSFVPRLHAARSFGTVIWDLMHFGVPDHVNMLAEDFPRRFAAYARAVARCVRHVCHAREAPMFSMINEMSFLAWAAGDMACMHPFEIARGYELKAQLVLATIAGIDAVRAIFPHARFLHAEPLIYMHASREHPKTWRRVACDNELQYQALDMLAGRVWPALGGHPRYLDIVGVNYYPDNQFMLDGRTIPRSDPRYRPLSELLLESWRHYERPLIISETGSEGESRADWLRYVAEQSLIALERGCELHGLTLYPVLNHPGWGDDRHCENGLWDYADESGARELYEPLAEELRRHAPLLIAARERMLSSRADLVAG